jgi:hypothetical protein
VSDAARGVEDLRPAVFTLRAAYSIIEDGLMVKLFFDPGWSIGLNPAKSEVPHFCQFWLKHALFPSKIMCHFFSRIHKTEDTFG